MSNWIPWQDSCWLAWLPNNLARLIAWYRSEVVRTQCPWRFAILSLTATFDGWGLKKLDCKDQKPATLPALSQLTHLQANFQTSTKLPLMVYIGHLVPGVQPYICRAVGFLLKKTPPLGSIEIFSNSHSHPCENHPIGTFYFGRLVLAK